MLAGEDTCVHGHAHAQDTEYEKGADECLSRVQMSIRLYLCACHCLIGGCEFWEGLNSGVDAGVVGIRVSGHAKIVCVFVEVGASERDR